MLMGYWKLSWLSVDPAVNAYTGITELKWGTTLEGVENSKRMEYYFYLMFPMDSIPSILEYTNINLLTKKKAPLTKGEIIKWLGIRLAMAVEPRRGPLPTYWKSESDVGVVSTAANYEGRFGMKLSRFTDISSCLQLAQEPKPQPVKVCVFCPFEIDVILIFPTCRILGGQLDPSSCFSMSIV